MSEIKGAPCARHTISAAGCTIFLIFFFWGGGGVLHPECAHFLSYLLLLHIRRVHETIPGCTVLGEVYPVGAHNKTLI